MPFWKELRGQLADFAASLRRRRAYGDVLQVEVAQDIVADAVAEQARVGDMAYSAEQADLEARKIIDQVLADKHVDKAEIALLEKAGRLISGSANKDHEITEACRA